jgi:DNA-binding NarL/FixJ family response regulator
VLEWHDPAVRKSVLIVDDHAGFRSWTRSLLTTEGFEVLGEAPDGASALTAVSALRPEVVLLDIMLPDTDGFEIAERLAALVPRPEVILLSSREASDFGGRIGRSPARGFISKSDLTAASLRAILDGS